MKRSEMVQLIWDYVQYVESDYDIYMEKQDCDRLLAGLEKAGMLPPLVKNDDYDDVRKSGRHYINVWDLEDEND